MKRILISVALLLFVTGCAPQTPPVSPEEDSIQIIASLFPYYEFAREIVGENGTVTLLLPPGTESHSFDPSPADIIAINKADLFLYTGPGMEGWTDQILEGIWNKDVAVIAANFGIELLEETPEEAGEHDHEAEEDTHLHALDPHIWTSPPVAKRIVQNIVDAVIAIDPNHQSAYQKNAEGLLSKLDKLDADIRKTVSAGARKEIYIGGRFAMRYFTEEYGLSYQSAFDSCSTETEPSVAVVVSMIESMKSEDVKVIYYEELTDPKVARSLSEETGARMLLLHSVHNLSKEDFARGETYFSLMEQNIKNLSEGLQP